MAILSRAGFVEHFTEAIDIRLRRPRAFWRDESFRAHVRTGLGDLRHQTDVRQFWHAVDEDDVRRIFGTPPSPPDMCPSGSEPARLLHSCRVRYAGAPGGRELNGVADFRLGMRVRSSRLALALRAWWNLNPFRWKRRIQRIKRRASVTRNSFRESHWR